MLQQVMFPVYIFMKGISLESGVITVREIVTTAEIWREGNMYTSYCPEMDVASCGHNPDEAKRNLQAVILIQLEETKRMGTLEDLLSQAGYTREGDLVTTGKKIVSFEEIRFPVSVL